MVLVGDAQQLQPIEPARRSRAIAERSGGEIGTITASARNGRGRPAWTRAGVQTGLAAYKSAGVCGSRPSREEAKARDRAGLDGRGRKDGRTYRAGAHARRCARPERGHQKGEGGRGELGGAAAFQTGQGKREFAAGDRIVFLKNDRELGVKNGTLGT